MSKLTPAQAAKMAEELEDVLEVHLYGPLRRACGHGCGDQMVEIIKAKHGDGLVELCHRAASLSDGFAEASTADNDAQVPKTDVRESFQEDKNAPTDPAGQPKPT